MKNIILILLLSLFIISCENKTKKPNIVFVFADQWRAQAMGYAGNSDVANEVDFIYKKFIQVIEKIFS